MLTSVNDYLSLAVLIVLCIFSLRVFIASLRGFKTPLEKKKQTVFDYPENEDE